MYRQNALHTNAMRCDGTEVLNRSEEEKSAKVNMIWMAKSRWEKPERERKKHAQTHEEQKISEKNSRNARPMIFENEKVNVVGTVLQHKNCVLRSLFAC